MSRMELSIATVAPPAPPAVVSAAEAPRKGPSFDLGVDEVETVDLVLFDDALAAPAETVPTDPAAPVASPAIGGPAVTPPALAAEDDAAASLAPARGPATEAVVAAPMRADEAQPDRAVAASPPAGTAPFAALDAAKVAAHPLPASTGASSAPVPAAEPPRRSEVSAMAATPTVRAEAPPAAKLDADSALTDSKAPPPPSSRGSAPEARLVDAARPIDEDPAPVSRFSAAAPGTPPAAAAVAAMPTASAVATQTGALGVAMAEPPAPVAEIAAEAPTADIEATTPVAQGSSGSSAGARVDGPSAAASAGVAVTPQAVTRQIAEAVVRQGAEGVEIRLDPPELGKVRMSLAPGEGSLTALITAERPETLDLLRRHADMLARDLAASGQGRVDLRFGADGQGAGGDPRDRPSGPYRTDPEPASVPHGRAWTGGGAGLDLRV